MADRHGIAVILAPTIRAADHIMRHVRQFAPAGRAVMAIASDEKANIIIQSSESTDPDKISDLAAQNAVFLVNDQGGFPAEKTEAYQAWFTQRFKFCQRLLEDGHRTIDAYLRVDIPCSALEASSSFGVRYDSGVRLHNVSFELKQDELRFYTAWTNKSLKTYAFSLQFFDEDGNKALQYDNVIYRDLLSTHEIDASSLPEGDYSIQLIVYDFETHVSQGGTIIASGQRFERELEIAKIEL